MAENEELVDYDEEEVRSCGERGNESERQSQKIWVMSASWIPCDCRTVNVPHTVQYSHSFFLPITGGRRRCRRHCRRCRWQGCQEVSLQYYIIMVSVCTSYEAP